MIDSPLLYEDYGVEVVLYKQPKLARVSTIDVT